MSAATWLERAAAAEPERIAVVLPDGALSYSKLAARARAVAGRLAAAGVRPGDRVAMALPAGAAFMEAFHGCLLIGAVAMPVDIRLAEEERAAQVEGAAVVVEEPLDGNPFEAPPAPDLPSDAVAVVMHTSGSSGAPRAVELTYGNWEAAARASAARLGADPDERWLCALPPSHVGGLSILVRSAIAGTTAIVHPRFDVAAVGDVLARGQATMVSLVPTTLARLLDAGVEPGPALRCALVGGAPLPAILANRALEAGYPIAHTYGLTEACSQVATSPIGEPETAGLPLDGTTIEIAPEGEILVAGPTVAPGAMADDGFIHTGDLGEIDERGRLTVTGRRSEIIVTGGENVAPTEVEAVLESHPAVTEALVYGQADPEWGEAVVARVVLRPGAYAGPNELRAHCAKALAGFKVPKAIGFADALSRTPSGKLRRDPLP